MLRIECVGCGKVKEVELGRGRPTFFCNDACRLSTYRRVRNDPDLQKEVQERKEAITRQYKEARESSLSYDGLRVKAARILYDEHKWSYTNIGTLFGITDERVRQILRKE
ncbi:MAG: hypothetical protein ACW99G_01500 [Candidatus Thorarchaeota archaeon]|jgi:DNA-directed RNA polymerase sigma subunit (sigma70/sigma32)